MRHSFNPFTSIREKDSARIKNTLKVKLQVIHLVETKIAGYSNLWLASLLKRNLFYVLSFENF